MGSSYNPFSLAGKTILVTGASSGIGRATAVECAKLGARVAITGRNADRLQETMSALDGEGHIQVVADLLDQGNVDRLIESCPKLDGVVLCAGRSFTQPFLFCGQEKYDDVFRVNFFSPVQLLRVLAKSGRLGRGGAAVVVSSTAGNQKWSPGNSIYGATKAALTATMRYCARELASKKIRVNGVNPAMVNTPLVQRFQQNLSKEQIESDIKRYPLGRYGEPDDIAHGIAYLLSDASSWVTGHSLVIDGGISI